jgi:putative ubiquitin-RnfH superfamily antitoxin RatB of RatAB toxin-antitoxin module
MSDAIRVELVLAMPDRQQLLSVEVESGATIADVIALSRIADRFPEVDVDVLQTGIWGKPMPRDHVVRDGDRVEFYRPLQMDPREARRMLANSGRSMGQAPVTGMSKDPD